MLAARIERAEVGLLRECAAAAARRRPQADVFALSIAGGIATFTAEGSPLNKLAGLGFAGAVEETEIEAAERAFAQRGAPLQVELSSLAEPSIATLLTRRGYTLVGFENVLGLALPPHEPPRRASEVEISTSPEDELATWLDVVLTGFATPDEQGVPSHESFPRESLERDMGDMASAAGLVRYLARVEGEPAGGASLRIAAGIAQLCGAATLPAQRRRGVQSSLLAERLEQAGAAGCDLAVVTTQPGSKSQENVQRLGFELLYTRAILLHSPRQD
jgi:ribosomal protein S18 acetylase RimI-like enzyme